MPKGLEHDKKDVLLSLYGYFLSVDGGNWLNAKSLKEGTKLRLSTSYICLLFEELRSDSHLEANDYDEEDGEHLRYTLTRAGVLEAEQTVLNTGRTLDEFVAQFELNRSSGLVVDTDHPNLVEADAALEELENHLRDDNDIGALTPEDREVAKLEVAELRETIKKPKVRTHYLWSRAHDVLTWIIKKGAGSMISELAKRALKPIQDFITVFFN